MSLLALPRELIKLIVVNLGSFKPKLRPPVIRARLLYAVCKGFKWLEELEYVLMRTFKHKFNLYAANLAGRAHGPLYCFRFGHGPRLEGFVWYEAEAKVGSYAHVAPITRAKFIINGRCYQVPSGCTRSRPVGCLCAMCAQLNAAERVLRATDPEVFRIADSAITYKNDAALFLCRTRTAQRPPVRFDCAEYEQYVPPQT
jgi:hypothetical protein